MTRTVTPGAQAPELTLPLVGGGQWTLNQDPPQVMTMIVVYRGLHCPICKDYLTRLQSMLEGFETAGASVVAVSMDSADRAAQTAGDWGLDRLRIAYGLSEAQARRWGLHLSRSINEKEASLFAEPGLFWVLPDGTIYLMDIANMPFARPDLELLLSRVPAIARGYPPRGTFDG